MQNLLILQINSPLHMNSMPCHNLHFNDIFKPNLIFKIGQNIYFQIKFFQIILDIKTLSTMIESPFLISPEITFCFRISKNPDLSTICLSVIVPS